MATFQPFFWQEIQLLGPTSILDQKTGLLSLPEHVSLRKINRIQPLLDYCDYLATGERNIPLNEADIIRVNQATILHLLCVGIDAWANERWLDFGSWILNKKTAPNYGKNERDDKLQQMAKAIKKPEAMESLRIGISELYKFYNKDFGKWRKFEAIVLSLPKSLAEILSEHYEIEMEGNINEVKSLQPTRKSQEENLRLIAEYLWDWRRNKFTHEAEMEIGVTNPTWSLLLGDSSASKCVVSCSFPEHVLVRSILLASIRKSMYDDVKRVHVLTHLRHLIVRHYTPEQRSPYIQLLNKLDIEDKPD